MKNEDTEILEKIKICLGEIVSLIEDKKWSKKSSWPIKSNLLERYGSLHDDMISDASVDLETLNHYQDAFEKFYYLLPVSQKDEAIKLLSRHHYVSSDHDEYAEVLSLRPRSGVFTFLLEERLTKLFSRPKIRDLGEINSAIVSLVKFNNILKFNNSAGQSHFLNKVRGSKFDVDSIEQYQRNFYALALDRLKDVAALMQFIREREDNEIFKNEFMADFFEKGMSEFEKIKLDDRLETSTKSVHDRATVRSVFINSGPKNIKVRFVSTCETAIENIKNPSERIKNASGLYGYIYSRDKDVAKASGLKKIAVDATGLVPDKNKSDLLYNYEGWYLRLANEFTYNVDFYRPIGTQIDAAFDLMQSIKKPKFQFEYAARIYWETIVNRAEMESLPHGSDTGKIESVLTVVAKATAKAKAAMFDIAKENNLDISGAFTKASNYPNQRYGIDSFETAKHFLVTRVEVKKEEEEKFSSMLDVDSRELYWDVIQHASQVDISNQHAETVRSLLSIDSRRNSHRPHDFFTKNAPENHKEVFSAAKDRLSLLEERVQMEVVNQNAVKVGRAEGFLQSLSPNR